MRLSRRIEPFDSEVYIFELKIDGFRSLAYVENGQCDLVGLGACGVLPGRGQQGKVTRFLRACVSFRVPRIIVV
jgi:hypothetical protein